MDSDLKERVVLVTGASGGIGSATARAFAAEGAIVALHARSGKERAEELADALAPARTLVVRADLRRESDAKRMFATVLRHFGRVDVLVANAASWEARDTPLHEMTLAQWDETIRSVLTSVFLCAREFLRCVEKQERGAMVLVGSTAGIFGEAGHADYAAAKSGVAYGLTRTLKNELGRLAPRTADYCGGRVNCVCPDGRGRLEPRRS
jgi:3-oxoacyl-[acyl-carrier protein] reductase